jgi:DNA-binding MarR family transcriptional regulator
MNKKPPPTIIPGWLDDYGLSPAQFRVLCRIIRRGECYESVEKMAKGCRMNKDTLRKAVKALVELGLVESEARVCDTNLLRHIDPTLNP